MALWIYRNNAKYQGDTVSIGDWTEFFDEYGADGPTEWGSTQWIKSPESRKIIREELRPGDVFLCWQTNKNSAIGLARFVEPRLVGEWTESPCGANPGVPSAGTATRHGEDGRSAGQGPVLREALAGDACEGVG